MAFGSALAIFAASAAYVALGAWILAVRPRRARNTWLAAYVGLFGVTLALDQVATWAFLRTGSYTHPAMFLAQGAGVAANLAALLLARHVAGVGWRSQPFALAALVGLACWGTSMGARAFDDYVLFSRADTAIGDVLHMVSYTAFFAGLALLAHAAWRRVERPLAALATFALMLSYSAPDGFGVAAAGQAFALGAPARAVFLLVNVLQDLAIAAAWIAIAVRHGWRPAMVTAVAILALLTAGALAATFVPAEASYVAAACSFVGVLLVAYAILRTQVLGLDVKVRFALKGSTIAAVFVTVFFLVSEAAQQFLSETSGSTYIGIAATGALVFALAPMQRLADRLADKAVPGAPTAQAPSDAARREATYRNALRLAMRDRTLTLQEERELAELADELGLRPSRAFALRAAVLEEAAAAADDRRAAVVPASKGSP